MSRPKWARPLGVGPHSSKGRAYMQLLAHARLFGRDAKYVELTAPTPIEEFIRSSRQKTSKEGSTP